MFKSYEEEEAEALQLVKDALTKLSKLYKSDPDKTGIKIYPESGCCDILADGVVKHSFFNIMELTEWMYEVVHGEKLDQVSDRVV